MLKNQLMLNTAIALVIAAAALPAAAQVTNSSRGGRLFSGTQAFPNQLSACTACHTIGDRRTAVTNNGGFTYNNALARLNLAINGPMTQYASLSTQDRADLAAYIAQLPSPEPAPTVNQTLLNFTASAVGQQTVPQTITLTNSVAASTPGAMALTVSNVSFTGTNSTDFRISANGCQGVNLAAGNNCSISVTFTPGAAGGRTAALSIAHNAIPASTSVSLTGTTSSTNPPPAGGGGGGGGTASLLWLLGLATALFMRRRLK
jgi:cytochrome c553